MINVYQIDVVSIYEGLPADDRAAFIELERRLWAVLEGNENWAAIKEYRGFVTGYLRAFSEEWEYLNIQSIIQCEVLNSDSADKFVHLSKSLSGALIAEIRRDENKGFVTSIKIDTSAKSDIRDLADQIKEILPNLAVEVSKKDNLFDKINSFLRELDRERTNLGSFLAATIQIASATGDSAKKLKPVAELLDKIKGLLGSGAEETALLPKWEQQRQIEGPKNDKTQDESELDSDED